MKNKLNLWQKLLEIKKQVPYLKEDKKSFGYDYASPEQVLGVLNPLFNEHGLLIKSEIESVEHKRITVKTKSGEKEETLFVVPMVFTIINTENPEERETFRWAGSGVNGDEKGFGSALTYAERYFFLKQFNIPTGKDDPDAFERKQPSSTNNNKPKQEFTLDEVRKTYQTLCLRANEMKIPFEKLDGQSKDELIEMGKKLRSKIEAAIAK